MVPRPARPDNRTHAPLPASVDAIATQGRRPRRLHNGPGPRAGAPPGARRAARRGVLPGRGRPGDLLGRARLRRLRRDRPHRGPGLDRRRSDADAPDLDVVEHRHQLQLDRRPWPGPDGLVLSPGHPRRLHAGGRCPGGTESRPPGPPAPTRPVARAHRRPLVLRRRTHRPRQRRGRRTHRPRPGEDPGADLPRLRAWAAGPPRSRPGDLPAEGSSAGGNRRAGGRRTRRGHSAGCRGGRH